MTDFDRPSLDRVLPSKLGSPDWADVMSRAGAHKGRSRRRVFALSAAALVVAVAAASAIGGVRDFFLDRGFIGLPPVGATPSAPEGGELLVEFIGRSAAFDSRLNRVWVYADGRIVWHREGAVAEGANELASGFLEQRLTPEGGERLRSELLATGLFDRDRSLLSEHSPWGTIRVQRGDALVRVGWANPRMTGEFSRGHTAATPEQVKALERVDALLADPASWLPASAWAVRQIRAYVPSRYAVCFAGMPPIEPPSRFVALLPESAQDMLRARDFNRHYPPGGMPCTDVTTEEARALGEAFDAAGLKPFEDVDSHVLSYRLVIPGPIQFIKFEPYLPHGEFTCSPCG